MPLWLVALVVFLVWQHGKNAAQNASTFAYAQGFAAAPASQASGMPSFDPIAIFDSRPDQARFYGTPCRSDGFIGCKVGG